MHDSVTITNALVCEGAVIKEGAIIEPGAVVGFKVRRHDACNLAAIGVKSLLMGSIQSASPRTVRPKPKPASSPRVSSRCKWRTSSASEGLREHPDSRTSQF